MPEKINRILAIARKEWLHIIHDPRSLMIIFLMPVLQLVMFGYALNMEIDQIDIDIHDYDNTPLSRDLIDDFRASEYFTVRLPQQPLTGTKFNFMRREARAALVISSRFSTSLKRGQSVSLQLYVDAADPNAGTLIKNYCTRVIETFNQKQTPDQKIPFFIKPRIWFNPDLKSAYFFVPGLVALILVMISALLTSITITREKESGTLEQILVSPVQAAEIILGKVLPYILLAFLDGFIILMLGIVLFAVPFQGSYLLLILLSTVYITTALSLGLMISTVVSTQQVAMMVALSSTLLPTVMLSGFIFPLRSMPEILQYIAYLVPAKYYLMIIRGVMLKGNTLLQLLMPTSLLLLMTIVLLRNAARKFRLNLEK